MVDNNNSSLETVFNFAIYSRKSRFSEKGESIENQIEMCKNYIFSNFPEVTNENIYVFEDEGFSGKNTKRPQFQKMIEDINKNKLKYIVCYKLDRISRSVIDFSNLIQELDSKEVHFISIKEQFDTSTPMGRAMMYISAVFAQMERETIAERVRDNLMLLARTGRWLGGVDPTGFTSERETEILVDGKSKSASYLKENDDMKTIELIFKKFLEFGSVCGTVNYLQENNIKTINNKLFSRTSIRKILRNPLYCTADKYSFDYFSQKNSTICFEKKDCIGKFGIISFNRLNEKRKLNDKSKWVIAIGKHRGVIDGSKWITIQNILDRQESIPRTFSKVSLLSGLIFCENCGSKMYSKIYDKNKDGSIRFYYVCENKALHGTKGCFTKNLHGQKTENLVIDYIMNFDSNKLKKDLNAKRFTRKSNKFKDNAEELHFQIIDIKNQQDKYIEYLLELDKKSTLIPKIEDKVKHLEKQVQKLQEQKFIYEKKFECAKDEKSDTEQILKNLSLFKEKFYTLDFENKKSLLRLVLNKLTWNGSDLKIFLNGETY